MRSITLLALFALLAICLSLSGAVKLIFVETFIKCCVARSFQHGLVECVSILGAPRYLVTIGAGTNLQRLPLIVPALQVL